MAQAPDFAQDHQIRLLQGTQEFFPALIEAMDVALADIQFETYIFDFTDSGAKVAEALMRAAQRGVRVHLVVDGVGTGRLPQIWADRLHAAGVRVRVYSPLGPLGLLLPQRWRRLHRKMCVVDGHLLFCGGINVLDDFHDPNHGVLTAPRLDFAVQWSPAVWWRPPATLWSSCGGACRPCAMCASAALPKALQSLRAASSGTARSK
jgi:cardiolipin synthase